MNELSNDTRAAIVRSLCEGNSIRATGRMIGVAKATIIRLLKQMGEFASIYQDYAFRNLKCTTVEADEIWSFVGAKAANATKEGQGDAWTYTAICAETKLMITWLVGPRNGASNDAFMMDLAHRFANRIQLSTDNWQGYTQSVEKAFGYHGVDYGQIKKVFGTAPENADKPRHGRYSPSAVVTKVEKFSVFGAPDPTKISTSYMERANLSIRMGNRRFTRLTNGFSKKAENHAHAVSLFFMYYNYCRPHQTLTQEAKGIKTTPAMAAGLTSYVWKTSDIVDRLDPKRRLSR